MHAKYSFLLPAYKTRFLKGALDSILAQTCDLFQVIISDDASPDPIQELVGTYEDSRLSYRRNASNLGASQLVNHWNLLLNHCDSEYVIIASDDDLYHPSFLERIEALTKQYPEADVLRAEACIIDQDGDMMQTEKCVTRWFSTGDFIDYLLQPESILCIGNFVFKTASLKAAGGFVQFPLGWKSDSATQLLLSGNGIPCTDDILFSFRMSGLNISSRNVPNREKDTAKLKAIIEFDDWLVRHIDTELLTSHLGRIRNRLEGESRSYLWTLSFNEFWRLFRKFRQESWFLSSRNKYSFFWSWIRSKYA